MDSNENTFQKETIVHKEQEDVNLLVCTRVIFKYRKMIILICLLAMVATVVVSLLIPKVYLATTSIVPPMEFLQKESGLSSGLLGSGQDSLLRKVIDVTGIADMYMGILKSRAVADIIVDRFNLMNVYKEGQNRTKVRAMLQRNTILKVSDEGIVEITVKDKDPNRAADIANAYVDVLDQQNKRLSTGQATSKRIFLENRLKEVEEKLSKIENILSREAKVQEMLYELLIREYEVAKIEEAKSMPTIQVLDKAIVPETRMPRGTMRKTALAGIVSFIVALVLAFARENFAKIRQIEPEEQWAHSFSSKHKDSGDSAFGELESQRKIVGAQRRRRVQEDKSYSRGA